jgi:hypothetical protein
VCSGELGVVACLGGGLARDSQVELDADPARERAERLPLALRAYLNRRGYVNRGELFGVGGDPAEGVVDGTLDWACEQ